MQIFIHLVFCHFLLLEFLFLFFFYSKKPSAFWQFVLEAVEAAWGQKSIKWLIRHKFPLLRTATSLISWHKIQNWGHMRSLKCNKASPMTLYLAINMIIIWSLDIKKFTTQLTLLSPTVRELRRPDKRRNSICSSLLWTVTS